MARPKLNLVIWKHLPEKGEPGSLYFVKDGAHAGETFIAARNGMLCPVPDIFNIVVPIGPAGRDGRDGATGKDGRDGKDGVAGPKGEPGDVVYIGPAEVAQAVQKVRAELVAQRTRFKALIIDKLSQCDHPVAQLAKVHLQNLLKESGL
jgi:hypothetical protein